MQMVAGALTAGYVFLVFSSTIISRIPGPEYRYQLEVFWSYKRAYTFHDLVTLWEDILNIFLLMPLGILIPCMGKEDQKLTRLPWVALCGLLLSVCIEVIQLMTKRGLFEFDDMINNTAGVMIGYGIYKVMCLLGSEK